MEKISDKESWLMRDIWQTTNITVLVQDWVLQLYRENLQSIAIKRIIDRALKIQGIRNNLRREGQKRHEFKAVHSFRKFFKTHAEQNHILYILDKIPIIKYFPIECMLGFSP